MPGVVFCNDKMLDKFAKMRQVKEAVSGVERIPDDSLGNSRDELADYENSLNGFRRAVSRYEGIINDLAAVSGDIAGAVSVISGNETAGKGFTHSANNIVSKVDANLQRLKSKTDQLIAMHAAINARLKDRDRAYFAKLHYEEKVNKIQTQPKGLLNTVTSMVNPDDDKAGRNDKKLEDATTDWLGLDDQCRAEVSDALKSRWDDSKQLIDMLNGIAVDVYTLAAQGFGANMKSSGDATPKPATMQSAPPPPTEEPKSIGGKVLGATKDLGGKAMDAGGKAVKDFRSLLGLEKKAAPKAAAPAVAPQEEAEDDSDLYDSPKK